MVIIENIYKSYSDFSISALNFKAKKGEFLSILGPSGSGKTTILNIISGQEKKFSGTVTIQDNTVEEAIKQGQISMVFQDSLLLPHLTVFENIVFGLRLKKIKKNEIETKGMKILTLLGLEDLRERFPNQLSGGQKQRVGIGRALIMEPLLLLMDEPFSALDGELREKMQNLIKKLQKTLKITIIFITHDKDEAFFLSDQIIIMEKGQIIRKGTPIEIYSQPLSFNVASFLGMENIISLNKFSILFPQHPKNSSTFIKEQIKENTFFIIPSERIEITSSINTNIENIVYSKGILKECIFKLGYYFIKVNISGLLITIKQNRLPFSLTLEEEVFLQYNFNDLVFIS